MKTILLGIFAVSMIISCSKPVEPMIPDELKPGKGTGTDTSTNPPQNVKLYPVLILDRTDSFVFEYNSDKSVKRMAYFRHDVDGYHSYKAWDRAFVYENGKLVSIGGDAITCDANGQIGDPTGNMKYVYDAQHRLTSMYRYNGTQLVDELTWQGKNIIKQSRPEYQTTVECKYDKSPNCLYSMYGAMSADYRKFLNENNVTERKVTSATESYTDYYTYKYNESGYPVQIEFHPDKPDAPTEKITTITYTK